VIEDGGASANGSSSICAEAPGAALGTVSLKVLATGIRWPPCWENATMNAPSLLCDLLQSAGRREIFRKCWFLWKL